jgi:isoquinoline 1-oxidoreductase subunit beta
VNLTIKSAPSLGRREFLKGAATVGGGLILGVAIPLVMRPSLAASATAHTFAPNAFIRVDRQGIVTLMMPMAEMGQGVHTALAMLLAEELEVSLEQVKLEQAPSDDSLYANPILHIQSTGASTSIRAFWTPLRQAGAVARHLLLTAAARRWGVTPDSCQAKRGVVIHTSSSRQLRYGELVAAAAALPVPSRGSVPLKHPDQFTLIGTSARRLDTAAKVDGRAQFGIDMKLPGMTIAAIAISPAFGGRPKSLNESAALAVRGVRKLVRLDNAVAAVADDTWAARKALAAAAIQWDDGPNGQVSTAEVIRQLEEASAQPGAVARHDGDPDRAMASAARVVEAVYQVPFLAHAAMEPMNCTVHMRKDSCEIWVGTQVPTLTQLQVAELTGLPKSAVRVHNQYLGGGFGRRLEPDGNLLAVRIAQHVDGPVKVIWSREEDIQHDMYRPYYLDRMSAALDVRGNPVAWKHRLFGSSVFSRYHPNLIENGVDPDAVAGAAQPPYELPNIHVEFVRVEPPGIPTSLWRGVGPTHNIFVVESFIDELAHTAKRDPVEYRKSLLARNPRALAVLLLAAEKGDWGRPLPARWGRGVAVQFAYGSFAAQVAEVEVGVDGRIRVHRIVCAIDCGVVVNPDTIAAQMEGGALFGLTAALYGEITLKKGRVVQSNFHDYRPMRINEAPSVETHVVRSSEAPGGVGEVPTATVSPAVANAVFAATGKRIRRLPLEGRLGSEIVSRRH